MGEHLGKGFLNDQDVSVVEVVSTEAGALGLLTEICNHEVRVGLDLLIQADFSGGRNASQFLEERQIALQQLQFGRCEIAHVLHARREVV